MKKIFLGIFILLLATGVIYVLFQKQEEIDYQVKNEAVPKREDVFIYETPAENADECSSYEDYNNQAGVCYFECQDEKECSEIENAIDEEFASWANDLEKEGGNEHETEQSENIVATYTVSKGENITLQKGKDAQKYQSIWAEIKELSPNSLSDKFIETYQVFDEPKNDSLAYVSDEDQNGKWTIAINTGNRNEFSTREQKATLIHELGHIISLNKEQVQNKTECKNLVLDEGCAKFNSYINSFAKTYWASIKNPTYDKKKFVTEYATTNEVEDFAETFAFFVIEKDKEKLGTEIKDQKIKSLYEHPELVEIRKEMRNTLGREIVRARKVR